MLTYKVLLKRYNHPLIPPIEQLKSVIKHGHDRYNNSLILNVYGLFELRYSKTLNNSVKNPSIVIRHETFSANNDYVGNEASADEILMERLYSTSAMTKYYKNLKQFELDRQSKVREKVTNFLKGNDEQNISYNSLIYNIFDEPFQYI